MRFVDTNILIYSVGTLPVDEAKTFRAIELLRAPDLALSVQVLQEFYVQSTRPSKPDRITHEQGAAYLTKWLRFPVQEMTVAILQAALATKARWQLSYWDAAIIESARALGCREVLSEDLESGCDYGGVHVTNPFVTHP